MTHLSFEHLASASWLRLISPDIHGNYKEPINYRTKSVFDPINALINNYLIF